MLQNSSNNFPYVPIRQTFSDSDVTISANTTQLAQNGTLTGYRTVTLPLANSVRAGSWIEIIDESGTANMDHGILFAVSGSDTIDGETILDGIQSPYGSAKIVSNGSNKWTWLHRATGVIFDGTSEDGNITITGNGTTATLQGGYVFGSEEGIKTERLLVTEGRIDFDPSSNNGTAEFRIDGDDTPFGVYNKEGDFFYVFFDPNQAMYVNALGVAPVTVTASTLTLDKSYAGKTIVMDSASAQLVNIPSGLTSDNAYGYMDGGFQCTFIQKGLGTLSFDDLTGVTLFDPNGVNPSTGQYSVFHLSSIGTDLFVLSSPTAKVAASRLSGGTNGQTIYFNGTTATSTSQLTLDGSGNATLTGGLSTPYIGVTPTTVTGSTLTLTAAHRGKTIIMNSASAQTVEIPSGISANGFKCRIIQRGNGRTTVTALSGVTLISPSGALTTTASTYVDLESLVTDTFLLTNYTPETLRFGANLGSRIYVQNTTPSSPNVEDLWYETNGSGGFKYGWAWTWNGTYWLSPQQYWRSDLFNITATNTDVYFLADPNFNYYLNNWRTLTYVLTTNSLVSHWTANLQRRTAANSITSIDTVSTSAHAADTWVRSSELALNLHVNTSSTAALLYAIRLAKAGTTATPGAIYFAGLLTFQFARI